MADDIVFDEMLGELRTGDVSGGTGGGGGSSYVAGAGININGETISATGSVSMTTVERLAFTPDPGFLIWDTDLEKLFVGDGSTTGGVEIEGGGGSGTVTGITASVTGNTATISATGSTTSVKLAGVGGMEITGNTSGDIFLTNSDGGAIYTATSSSLAANTPLVAVQRIDNQKNEVIEFWANFSGSFGSLTISHGKGFYGGQYIVIDSTTLTIYNYDGSGVVATYNHGLTLTDFVHVLIYRDNSNLIKSYIKVMTVGGQKEFITKFYSRAGGVYAEATFAMTDAAIQYSVCDACEDVWIFGDSYLDTPIVEAWSHWLLEYNYKHVLLCGTGGAKAADELTCLNALLTKATPKYIVWALGMNNQDSGDTINASWLECAEALVATCEAKGITPIFCTIPNTPTYNNVPKNAWVKSHSYRYIDLADAVGASAANSSWYTGMLGSDGVHPSELGATTLFHRAANDAPEILKPSVPQDVNLWTPLNNKGGSFIIYAGTSFAGDARKNITVYAPSIQPGFVGLDSHIQLKVGQTWMLKIGSDNIIFTDRDKLIPEATNNLKASYRDEKLILTYEDHYAGYVVTNTSASDSGSLNYAISSASEAYVMFNPSTDGSVYPLGGATVTAEKHIVGNGFDETTVSGSISGSTATTFSNLTCGDITVVGGTTTLGKVNIPAGATVDLTSAYAKMYDVSGGGTVILGNYQNNGAYDTVCVLSGLTISGGTSSPNYTAALNTMTRSVLTANKCHFTNNSGYYGAVLADSGTLIMSGCSFDSAVAQNTRGGCLTVNHGAVVTVYDTVFQDNASFGPWTVDQKKCGIYLPSTDSSAAPVTISGCTFGRGYMVMTDNVRSIRLQGSNVLKGTTGRIGGSAQLTILIADGAVVDLSGNANTTVMAGSIQYGSNVTIINSAGESISLNGGTAGSCIKINNDGTTE